MIMRGSIPRSLSAAGLLGVLGLAALLLPFVPTWAQAEPPDYFKIEVADTKGKEADPARRAEIDKVRQEAKKAAEELERLQLQMRAVEKRLHDTLHRLAELGGGGGGDGAKMLFLLKDGKELRQIPMPAPAADIYKYELKVGGDPAQHLYLKVLASGDAVLQGLKARVDERQAELTKAEKEFDALRKKLEEVLRIVKDTPGGAQVAEALAGAVKAREQELAARRTEVAALKAQLEAAASTPPTPTRTTTDATRPLPDTERKLLELERKLAELMREVQGLKQSGLRDERRPVPPVPPVPPASSIRPVPTPAPGQLK